MKLTNKRNEGAKHLATAGPELLISEPLKNTLKLINLGWDTGRTNELTNFIFKG